MPGEHDAGVDFAVLDPALGETRKILQVVTDQDASCRCRVAEVLLVRRPLYADFLRGDGIEAVSAEVVGNLRIEVVIQVDGGRQARDGRYSAISSGNVSQV